MNFPGDTTAVLTIGETANYEEDLACWGNTVTEETMMEV